ncbi:hypothetical protein SOVF_068470 [Spinacia oleracea]|nr:hypothetical protein SOVF_068470 [Spinacia oleracea]
MATSQRKTREAIAALENAMLKAEIVDRECPLCKTRGGKANVRPFRMFLVHFFYEHGGWTLCEEYFEPVKIKLAHAHVCALE